MKTVIIISLTILGLMGYLNLGGPQRLANDDYNKLQQHDPSDLSNATQDSWDPVGGRPWDDSIKEAHADDPDPI